MNTLLELEDLVAHNKKKEQTKLNIFIIILKSCHEKIKRLNILGRKDTLFRPPQFIFGQPAYDYDALITYLIHHLRDNGLYVEWREVKDLGEGLWISWNETDINYSQYMSRKARIQQTNNIYNEDDQVTNNFQKHTLNSLCERQTKQIDLRLARESRINKQSRTPQTSSYQDFVKSY